jgi:4-hydroxy-4-methyl-2-oxoglutarate aldolase
MKIYARSENQISAEMKERFSKIETATIGHYLHFGFMSPAVKPVNPHATKMVGHAFTVKTAVDDSIMVHKAVSMASEGDVIVIDRSGDTKHACVGEMVAYAAKLRKIAGIIIDGPATDISAITKIGIPVFSTGVSPITTKLLGNSGEINTSITCGGVAINPGDLIVADESGVVVLPPGEVDYEDILQKVEEDEADEVKLKALLDKGESLAHIAGADEMLREKGIIE